jgi:ubiquinone/menaquinone biosynthesis C-methylase UbiE
MSEKPGTIQDIVKFWNDRADLGPEAGTPDLVLKQLEINAIARHVRDGMRVLDAGCGNGITAIELARRYRINLLGMDIAEKMVAAAAASAANQILKGSVTFQQGDVRSLSGFSEKFDLIYTERVLINLPDWPSQLEAIKNIIALLRVGGLYLMCESSQDGLNGINSLRKQLGLEEINPPWHNRYLRDQEITQARIAGGRLVEIDYFTSTYYFLSRIINAWLAVQEGKEPDYQAPVNQLALHLPPRGKFGQVRLWVWKRVRANPRRSGRRNN